MKQLTHLSLFSGIGGLDLAAEWAGFETVGQCEWANYPTKVLEKHWPDVPRWRDIRTLTKESFYEQTGLRTVDIISGGFPCQPFSTAGRRRGKEDDRYLWPEMLRVIRELQPSWVVGENVPGIINLALDEVLASLEGENYEVQSFIIPACGVDAPHRRYRLAIVAHSNGGSAWEKTVQSGRQAADDGLCGEVRRSGCDARICGMADGIRSAVYETDTDTHGDGLSRRLPEPILETGERERGSGVRWTSEKSGGGQSVWQNWLPEPGVGRVADGVPNRVDRLKCLGNAVVPQQFYPIFKAIYDIETTNH